ncbi:hypothetical protein [Glycomyces harbinensis]|uniref:Porin n=1 Tax=Glycomyces harbinensis TaxID=58114 RepID=A0A1G6VLT5_9ACTN|nr:hypothetical protein [Glycomyces harbinensis]SDD54600.1 hypothetical protein SAMN05216270_10519 [Glycomyces harbinensis]
MKIDKMRKLMAAVLLGLVLSGTGAAAASAAVVADDYRPAEDCPPEKCPFP